MKLSVKVIGLCSLLLLSVHNTNAQTTVIKRPDKKVNSAKPRPVRPIKKPNVTSKPKEVTVVKNTTAADRLYMDLGMPSGTLWKSVNEDGFYDYDSATSKFGGNLPTREQWLELKEYCKWVWKGNGYEATGKNDNSIFLPAAGYRYCVGDVDSVGSDGDYWASTPNGSEEAWDFFFNSGGVGVNSDYRCNGLSVRLVQN